MTLLASMAGNASPMRRVNGEPSDVAVSMRARPGWWRGVSAPARSGVRALAAARVDVALVASITALAAFLRLWHLGTVPLGLHGDEAITGLDARRVLHEGWIGPYVLSALGQPTGPLYSTAALFKVMPESTFTVRFSMTLFGIATIPLAYAAFAVMFNRTTAAFAALLLAVMTWHLHLSRTGFMVNAWPFVEVTVLWALFAGLRRRSPLLLAVAGTLAGLGIYTYNAYLLFIPVPIVALLWSLVRAGRDERARLMFGIGAFAVAAVLVALPMLQYIFNHGDTYHYHERAVGVTHSQAWHEAGTLGRANILRHRFDEWIAGVVTGDRPDFGDGLAAPGHPVVDPVTAVLAAFGIVFALWRWRRPEYAVILAALVLMPLGALSTTGDGLFRRTFGLAPFIAALAAFPLAYLWERTISSAPPGSPLAARGLRFYAMIGVVLAFVAFPAVANSRDYFGPVQDTVATNYTFPFEMDAASRYVAGLPRGTYVEFYSDRWSFDYETRRFLAPDAPGDDRSFEFDSTATSQLNFDAPARGDVAFVFLGRYLDDADQVIARYPDGTLTEGMRDGALTFRAYFLARR
jgi:4-amino-4-deoxy-L-arabinose transferase-like glycosyltransferase